jgi:hypothetical protein
VGLTAANEESSAAVSRWYLVEEKEDAQNSTAMKKRSLEVPTKADPNGFMKVHACGCTLNKFEKMKR